MLLLTFILLCTHPTSTTLFPVLSKLTISIPSFEDLTDNSNVQYFLTLRISIYQTLLYRIYYCSPNSNCHTISKTTKSHLPCSWIEGINSHAHTENINRLGIVIGVHWFWWKIAIDHHLSIPSWSSFVTPLSIIIFHSLHLQSVPTLVVVDCICTGIIFLTNCRLPELPWRARTQANQRLPSTSHNLSFLSSLSPLNLT
jgi:hypothetical protein